MQAHAPVVAHPVVAASPDPTSVYRYYDANDVLLYAGITRQGMGRNLQHNGKAEWWQYVTRQEVEHYPTRAVAMAREKALIREFRPPFNKQHNPDHALTRESYLRLAASRRSGEDPYEAYKAGPKVLDCEVHDAYGKHLILRSRLDDALLCASLGLHLESTPVYAVHRSGRHNIGFVQRIEREGPLASIYCKLGGQKMPTEIVSAQAKLGWQQLKRPHFPFLKSVKLLLPGAEVTR